MLSRDARYGMVRAFPKRLLPVLELMARSQPKVLQLRFRKTVERYRSANGQVFGSCSRGYPIGSIDVLNVESLAGTSLKLR